ncbi:hypothetical protein ACI65C_007158 [Semiaphis heraclei]
MSHLCTNNNFNDSCDLRVIHRWCSYYLMNMNNATKFELVDECQYILRLGLGRMPNDTKKDPPIDYVLRLLQGLAERSINGDCQLITRSTLLRSTIFSPSPTTFELIVDHRSPSFEMSPVWRAADAAS